MISTLLWDVDGTFVLFMFNLDVKNRVTGSRSEPRPRQDGEIGKDRMQRLRRDERVTELLGAGARDK